VEIHPHVRTAAGALKRWFIAQCYDSLCVAALWFIGLEIIGVPLAIVWALLAGLFQFVPNLGPVLSLVGPAAAVSLKALLGEHGDWYGLAWVLTLYAVIVVIDGLLLQPYLMKRQNRVPIWASIVAPLLLGFFFHIWGVLASGPLLAIVYAFRNKRNEIDAASGDAPTARNQRLST
jgi:predicted PurR-regulated permease PerM